MDSQLDDTQRMLDSFSEERIAQLQVRRKVRRLTELCLACSDVPTCTFGLRLVDFHEACCASQVGNDFWHCANCQFTRSGCVIDANQIAGELHEQLARCTEKRGLGLPLELLRFDILWPGLEKLHFGDHSIAD